MANWKVTYLFKSDVSGWSEQWYIPLSVSNPVLLTNPILSVLEARLSFMGQGARSQGFRVVDVDNPGTSWFSPVAPTYGNGKQPVLPADNPTTCVDVRFNAGNFQYRRVMNLRGCPDDWVIRNPTTLTMTWTNNITQGVASYTAALQAAGFALRVISKGAALVNLKPVRNVSYAAFVVTVTSPNHGFAEGEEIRIRGVKGTAGLVANGIHQIQSVTLNTLSFPVEVDPGIPITYTKGGFIRRRVRVYATVDEGLVQSVSKRDTGRTFFLPVGRRPRR